MINPFKNQKLKRLLAKSFPGKKIVITDIKMDHKQLVYCDGFR